MTCASRRLLLMLRAVPLWLLSMPPALLLTALPVSPSSSWKNLTSADCCLRLSPALLGLCVPPPAAADGADAGPCAPWRFSQVHCAPMQCVRGSREGCSCWKTEERKGEWRDDTWRTDRRCDATEKGGEGGGGRGDMAWHGATWLGLVARWLEAQTCCAGWRTTQQAGSHAHQGP